MLYIGSNELNKPCTTRGIGYENIAIKEPKFASCLAKSLLSSLQGIKLSRKYICFNLSSTSWHLCLFPTLFCLLYRKSSREKGEYKKNNKNFISERREKECG